MSDFKAKMLTALPRPPNWNKGDLLLREGEESHCSELLDFSTNTIAF